MESLYPQTISSDSSVEGMMCPIVAIIWSVCFIDSVTTGGWGGEKISVAGTCLWFRREDS